MPGCSIKRIGSPRPRHRMGVPNSSTIQETDANFTIERKGHHRIEGDVFIYVDRKTGGTRAILGYPRRSWSKPRAAAEISIIFG